MYVIPVSPGVTPVQIRHSLVFAAQNPGHPRRSPPVGFLFKK